MLLPSVRVKYLCEENLDIIITRACDMQFSESDEFCIIIETQDQSNTSVIVDHSQLVNL